MRKLLIEVTIEDNGDISLSAVQDPQVEAATEEYDELEAVTAPAEPEAAAPVAVTEPETPAEIAAAPAEENQTQTQQL